MANNPTGIGGWKKGQSGNPGGRPIDQTKYLKKIDTTMTLKEWRAIVLKAIGQAKRGDAKARQWLGDYLAGKPIQPVDVTSKGEVIRTVGFDVDKV